MVVLRWLGWVAGHFVEHHSLLCALGHGQGANGCWLCCATPHLHGWLIGATAGTVFVVCHCTSWVAGSSGDVMLSGQFSSNLLSQLVLLLLCRVRVLGVSVSVCLADCLHHPVGVCLLHA